MNELWNKIEDILFDGTMKEIDNLKCPECKRKIFFEYSHVYNSLQYGCKHCNRIIRMNGCHQIPNCADRKFTGI